MSAHDPATGQELWHFSESNRFPIPMPLQSDGVIYTSRGYRSSPFMAIRPGWRREHRRQPRRVESADGRAVRVVTRPLRRPDLHDGRCGRIDRHGCEDRQAVCFRTAWAGCTVRRPWRPTARSTYSARVAKHCSRRGPDSSRARAKPAQRSSARITSHCRRTLVHPALTTPSTQSGSRPFIGS